MKHSKWMRHEDKDDKGDRKKNKDGKVENKVNVSRERSNIFLI